MLDFEPTRGERLWLWRRANKLSPRAAAAQLGWTLRCYAVVELDEVEAPDEATPIDHDVTMPDKLRLMRRRDALRHADNRGERHRKLCEELDISHVTLLKWERRGDERLVKFWDALRDGNDIRNSSCARLEAIASTSN